MEYYTEETDNTTKNIVHEIVREGAAIGLEIDANFCTYYVKLLTLDPKWNISPEKKINRENIQTLVFFIIEKMKLVQSPSLTTMKMQQHFLSHFLRKATTIENQRQLLRSSADPLLENLMSLACTDANKTRFFKRIVLYIALMIDLGNPKNYLVFKETNTAFKSIIEDPSDFYKFGEMKPGDKISYIQYLESVVFGIRLFNRDSGRAIAEIDDMPKLISQALVSLNEDFHSELRQTIENIQLTTSAIENMFYFTSLCKTDNSGIRSIIVQMNKVEIAGITDEDVNHLMEMLVMYHQYEMYLRLLISRLQESEYSTKNLIDELVEVFQKLRNTIKYNIGISTIIVFPLFIELGTVWRKFQDEFIVISMCGQIFSKLRQFLSNESINEDKFNIILQEKMERSENTSKIKDCPELVCELLEPTNVHFEFSGYCIWTFTETKGVLIPGKPQLGILKWRDKYYCFVNSEAAYVFGKEPDSLILKAYSIIRKKPELIAVLKLQAELVQCRQISILVHSPETVRTQSHNKMYQTELHPIRSHIDPDYIWNVWDYYHQACRLATVIGYQTHSVQTIKSNFRYSVPVQTTELREKESQTKKNNYMNVATPSNFFFGLRGRKDDNQHIVDLTRPVDEERYRSCATAMDFPPPCQSEFKSCKKSTQKRSQKFNPPSFKTTDSSVSIPGEFDYTNLLSCMCVQELRPAYK